MSQPSQVIEIGAKDTKGRIMIHTKVLKYLIGIVVRAIEEVVGMGTGYFDSFNELWGRVKLLKGIEVDINQGKISVKIAILIEEEGESEQIVKKIKELVQAMLKDKVGIEAKFIEVKVTRIKYNLVKIFNRKRTIPNILNNDKIKKDTIDIEKIKYNSTEELIGIIARQVDGVACMSKTNIVNALLGREDLSQGVKIEEEKSGIIIDLYLIIEARRIIYQVAQLVQDVILDTLQENTKFKVKEVNIHIQGIKV